MMRALLLSLILAATAPAQDKSLLPRWLEFNIEQRSRLEGRTGLGYEPGENDGYYLNRLRFNIGLLASDWLRFDIQVQDSRQAGERKPLPAKVHNPFDLRGAYVDIGKRDTGWLLRAGRQVLEYGDARLIGPGPWSNVPRVFDAARLAYRGDRYRLEWFAGTRAAPDENGFDRFREDDRIAGFYPTFQLGPKGTELEPYFIWKELRGQSSEFGQRGGKNAYTGGARFAGPLPRRFSYSAEAALQRGDQAGDGLGAWATSLRLARVLKQAQPGVRLFVEYDYASGDNNPSDGKAGTFDQVFPSNHGKYGIADMMGWRNMHGLRVGVPLDLGARLSLNADYHSFWLASLQDALYRASGAAVIRNPDASSNHAFQELDIYGVLKLAQPLDLLAGYAHIFPGTFLKESTAGSATTYAYVQLVLTIRP